MLKKTLANKQNAKWTSFSVRFDSTTILIVVVGRKMYAREYSNVCVRDQSYSMVYNCTALDGGVFEYAANAIIHLLYALFNTF